MSDRVADLVMEHRQLRSTLFGIAESLASTAPRRELVVRFDDLRVALVAHFSFEEKDGYFRTELSAAPWLANEAGRLLRQHGRILEELDRLQAMLASAGGVDSELRAAFGLFRRRLERHEKRENRLVQSAYNRDLTASD